MRAQSWSSSVFRVFDAEPDGITLFVPRSRPLWAAASI
jgi:hypothetical protein